MLEHGLAEWFLKPPGGDTLSLPYLCAPPAAAGRRLPHRGWLVVDEATPDWIYKFSHWEQSALAWNEIDIYARLQSLAEDDGIVRMAGISSREDYLVRVMERSRLGTLERVLRDRAYAGLPAPTSDLARRMLVAWAQSLARLHAAGIVHRDVKAENILMFGASAEQGWSALRGKLSDFDRAVLLPPDSLMQAPVGSLFHMAPELHRHQAYGRKVDVYAFGILIFELMHGADRPYPGVATGLPGSMTRAEFAAQVAEMGYRPAWQHEDGALRQLAAQCWADKPEDRPEFFQIVETLQVPSVSVTESRKQQQIPAAVRHAMAGSEAKSLGGRSCREKVGLAGHIGCVRHRMEDAAAFVVDHDTCVLGVFDGMLGQRASDWTARALPLMLREALAHAPSDGVETWQHVFARMQTVLRRLSPALDSGSTATLAWVDPHVIQLGWVGDSPAWLLRQEGNQHEQLKAVPLTTAHHPDKRSEADRVLASGGIIRRETKMMDSGEEVEWGPLRVYVSGGARGISLTRALGLPSMSSVLSTMPQVRHVARQDTDRFLVLASDGVFEVMTIQQLGVQLMQAPSVQQAVSAIIDQILKAGAPDNSTLVVMDLSGFARP